MPQKKKTKIPAKLVKYLDKAGINHEVLEHRTVYTAFDAAATTKKKLNEIEAGETIIPIISLLEEEIRCNLSFNYHKDC